MEEEKKSKISNVEWGLVIGALLMIDLLQIGIDLIGIGLIVNRFLDIFVGMGFAFYLQMRGQSMASPKRLFSLLAVFGLEMIPVVDALPLWCRDGIFNMSMSKSDKILKNVPGGEMVSSSINKIDSNINRFK